MVLDSIFSVTSFTAKNGEIKATLRINESHNIFEGHFPGLPVVPGVCMMQCVKELVERSIDKKLMITGADNMKFLSVMDPRENKVVEAAVSYTNGGASYLVTASLFAGNITFFKLKATLNISN